MARLIRGALAFVVLATLCVGAGAEPITTFLASAAFTTAAGVAVSYGAVISAIITVASVASSLYGSVQAKKQARAAAQRKFQQDVANLQDRTTTIVASDDAWPVIYGQPAPVGGSIKAVITSGDKAQYKHIVLVLASHECEAVDDVLIDGESLQLNDYGSSQHPAYQLEYGIPRDITYPFEVQSFSIPQGVDGTSSETIYAALVNTSADGQFYNPQIVNVKNAQGDDITGVLGLGSSINVPGQIGFPGFVLMGDQSHLGLTGNVTIRVDGGGSALHVSKHLSRGGVDFADPFIMGSQPTLWTPAHKLTGYTYLVITINLLLERFQGGMPTFTARVRGKRIYDPRSGQTVYSRNPALCLADFLRSEAGYLAKLEQIEPNALIAAANACDQVVYGPGAWNDRETYGNDTRLYACDGMFRSDQDRDTTRQQLEDAMAGYSLESGGVWRIMAGAWSTPVLALTDDDLLGPTSVVQTCNPGTARYNGARGVYVNQGRNGVSEDLTPYVNAVFRAADEKDKWLDIALSFTASHTRCHQLARTLVEQSRGGLILQISPKMLAWHLQPGDRITLSSVVYGFANKRFRVQDWTYVQNTPLSLQIIEDEPSFYDTADEVQADPAPNTNLPSPFLVPAGPFDVAVHSGVEEMVIQGGIPVVRAHVTWALSNSPAVRMGGTVRVQWRTVVPVGEWQTADLPGDAVEAYILGLEVNSQYQVRVRFQTPYVNTAWVLVDHTVIGNPAVPGDVDGLSLQITPAGVVATWGPPVGLDLLEWGGTSVRVGATWELAIEVFSGKTTTANIGWLPAGSVKVWAAHFNTAGVSGVAVATVIEILPPAQTIVHGEVWSAQIELKWQDCRTTQPIGAYLVKVGPTLAEAVEIGQTPALNYARTEPTAGTRLYWVIAFDAAGNAGPAGYVELASLPSIEEALEELSEGLDPIVEALLNINSGVSQRLVEEAISRGTAIDQVRNLVTEGNEQLAQRIDTVTALAVGYVRANLVANGGFEFDLDGWTNSGTTWTVAQDDWGVSARLLLSVPADGWLASPRFPVKASNWYAASADTRFNSNTGSSGLVLAFFDAAGASLAPVSNMQPGRHEFQNDQARRNAFAVEGQAPAGAKTASVMFMWSGYTAGGALGVRYVKAEMGRFPVTPYTSETSDRGAVAAVREEATARASADAAEAALRMTLTARVDGNEASIEQESIVRAEQTGKLFARWGLKVTAGNKTAGIILNNDGEESDLVVLVDRFAISTIGEGGVIKYPFVVGTVASVSTVGIDGNLVVDGSITARTLDVNQLSAITSRLGYVTAGQVDIAGDGVGGWGFLRSLGKWYANGQDGWVFARHTDGSTLAEIMCGASGLQMNTGSNQFRLWGPGFNLENGGLTINAIDVIDTLQLRGQAVTIPSFATAAANSVTLNHFVPGADTLQTFILGTTFVLTISTVSITVDGNIAWIGAGVAGSTVTGGIQVPLAPGWHTLTISSGASAGSAGSSIYALSTRR